jgi:4-amino-4-deoxy-L-arabinose transferase-like glycosyltransferase
MSIAGWEVAKPATPVARWLPAASLLPAVMLVTCLAALLRVLFYPGFFGSDEVTYTESAFKLLHGDWSVAEYVGANRYGVNLPVAAFGWAFGESEASAAVYSLLCSTAEVALVTAFGIRMLGMKAGILAGLLLATLPLHVHYAGRLMADAPLCLAVSASFLLFWDAETRGSRLSYFLAGCAAGLSFWVKPAVVFYLLVFAIYPLIFRRFDRRWGWFVLGLGVVILANNVLFWGLTGRFWFLFDVMKARKESGYLEEGAAAGAIESSPGFYLVLLFLKIYHTGLLGYAAFAALAWWLAALKRGTRAASFDFKFVVWWAIGLVTALSLLIVSFNPLTLIPKQTNYMLIFAAPLCLLGATALAKLRGWGFTLACAAVFVPALLLGLMEQAAVQVFTANSKATVRFAQSHPTADVYAASNAYRAGTFHSLVNPGAGSVSILPMERYSSDVDARAGRSSERFAVLDLETAPWGSEPIQRLDQVPPCWQQIGILEPSGMGAGPAVARVARTFVRWLPAARQPRLERRLSSLAAPLPAHLFSLSGCGRVAPSK